MGEDPLASFQWSAFKGVVNDNPVEVEKAVLNIVQNQKIENVIGYFIDLQERARQDLAEAGGIRANVSPLSLFFNDVSIKHLDKPSPQEKNVYHFSQYEPSNKEHRAQNVFLHKKEGDKDHLIGLKGNNLQQQIDEDRAKGVKSKFVVDENGNDRDVDMENVEIHDNLHEVLAVFITYSIAMRAFQEMKPEDKKRVMQEIEQSRYHAPPPKSSQTRVVSQDSRHDEHIVAAGWMEKLVAIGTGIRQAVQTQKRREEVSQERKDEQVDERKRAELGRDIRRSESISEQRRHDISTDETRRGG